MHRTRKLLESAVSIITCTCGFVVLGAINLRRNNPFV